MKLPKRLNETRIIFATLLLSFVGVAPQVVAQEPTEQDVQEILTLFDETVNEIVNSATLFSSQDAVSSGSFKFYDDVDPDAKLDVLKIPLRYSFESDPDATVKPFITGHLGNYHYREVLTKDQAATGRDDFSVIDSFTFEFGGGAELLLFEGFTLTPEFSLAYTKLENRFDYNNDVSQEFVAPLDGLLFNWDIEALTYAPGVGAAYQLPFHDIALRVVSSFVYLYNDSLHSSSPLIDISSDTSIFQNGLKSRVPLGVQLFGGELALDPYVLRNDVQGDARKGLGFDHFYETGADFALGTADTLGVFSEVTAGASFTWASDFDGVRIGLGASF